jgi:copper oxidase (laccase) domain-containing protein
LYSGITAENIFVSEHKTISEPDLFASARLDKENRRDNIMLAMLR